MRFLNSLLAGSLLMASACPAFAGSATLTVAAHIPVQCHVAVLGAEVDANQLRVTLRRHCNTGHTILLEGANASGIADLTITEVATGRSKSGASAVFAQPERYVDSTDQFLISSPSATAEDLRTYAATLRISVETA